MSAATVLFFQDKGPTHTVCIKWENKHFLCRVCFCVTIIRHCQQLWGKVYWYQRKLDLRCEQTGLKSVLKLQDFLVLCEWLAGSLASALRRNLEKKPKYSLLYNHDYHCNCDIPCLEVLVWGRNGKHNLSCKVHTVLVMMTGVNLYLQAIITTLKTEVSVHQNKVH